MVSLSPACLMHSKTARMFRIICELAAIPKSAKTSSNCNKGVRGGRDKNLAKRFTKGFTKMLELYHGLKNYLTGIGLMSSKVKLF